MLLHQTNLGGYTKSIILTLIVLSSNLFAQLPDLIVTSGGFSPSTIAHGNLLTISATVQNAGTGNSPKTHLSFYLSSTTNISNGTCIGCVSVEPLAASASSESKQMSIPIPTSLGTGSYYVGWIVDPYNEVVESNENNGFYLPSSQLTITSTVVFTRHIPYPIIFIHGLNSYDQTWNTFFSQLDLFGWSFGGRMDYCLNYDGILSTSLLVNDLHDFTVQSTLNIGDYYTVNFDVNADGTIYKNTVESNQAAIVKQGKAMQSAIKHVLDKTGADKVILVGHSMGGLASREYLQNSSNWQSDGKHHVAKLLTIGTPHGGSNAWTFGGLGTIIDGFSEALRDLRWSYLTTGDSGVYLFGGNENNLSTIGFHNTDVNCNGSVGDNIVGLNQKDLYTDLVYSCVIATAGLFGDEVVDASRANLNNYYSVGADTFLVLSNHTDLPKQIMTNLQGLDEPTYFNQAYRVGTDSLYFGLITTQSAANSFTDDYDDYFINLNTNNLLNIKVNNISVPQLSVAIFDSIYTRRLIKFSNTLSQIDTTILLGSGKYYVRVEAQPTSYSWQFPYSFKLHSTPVNSVESNVSLVAEGFCLLQNYPNPFNPSTNISFHIPSRTYVSVKIFDLLGREVANLVSGKMEAGDHYVIWDASTMSSGTYFYRLQSGNFVDTKKLILIKEGKTIISVAA
jgi:pimeloyl-ACP methyl ester carboxylesterase